MLVHVGSGVQRRKTRSALERQTLCSVDNALFRLMNEINLVLKPIILCWTTDISAY